MAMLCSTAWLQRTRWSIPSPPPSESLEMPHFSRIGFAIHATIASVFLMSSSPVVAARVCCADSPALVVRNSPRKP